MKTVIKIFTVINFLLCANFSFSQNPMQPFLDLKGHWEGKVDLTLGEAEFQVTYLLDFSKTSDNNGMYMNERCTIPGVGTLIGSNLIGYDPYEGKYHWFSVDNFGTTHDHIGSFSEEGHFYMEHQSLRGEEVFLERIWIDWLGPDQIKLKLVATLNGVTEQIAEGIFKRKNNGNSL